MASGGGRGGGVGDGEGNKRESCIQFGSNNIVTYLRDIGIKGKLGMWGREIIDNNRQQISLHQITP